MQLHLVLVRVEVINGVFRSIKRFDLWHSEFCRKREVQHPGGERGFSLLYQGVHRDWSLALYRFLHVAELLLDVPEPLFPRPLPCFLLIRDGSIAFIVPTMPLLITILSGGLVRVMPLGLASFSFSICFSKRVEVLLFFLDDGVLAFSGRRASWGRCICLVSCSNSRRWLVRLSASISSVLTCRASSVPLGGRLSMSPSWSGILGGLAWLLLVFRVDTISH